MAFLLKKYTPEHSSDIVGNAAAMHKLKDFIVNYKTQKKKACIVHGPLGTGKTSSIYAIAKELDYDLLEINSSDLRNKDAINKFLSAALGQMSLMMKPKIVLIDEVDNTSGRKDRGGTIELAKVITKSKYPIVCTANDGQDKKLKALRKVATILEFKKPDHDEIITFFKTICTNENIIFDDNALSALSRSCDGDLRAALLDLQILRNEKLTLEAVMKLDDRKRTQTILHALKVVFKSSTAETARTAFNDVDLNPDEILLWLEYNLPYEYKDPKALSESFNYLSRADIFKKRIMKWQHWRYLVYIFDLLSAGVSTAKEERNPNTIPYKRSSRLLKMWMAKNKNAKKRDISEKYAKSMHTSSKVAMKHLPYLKHIIKHSNEEQKQEFYRELELTNDEIMWLRK